MTGTQDGTDAGAQAPLHLVILGHPREDSVNHAIAAAYVEAVRAAGQRAELRDLYAMGFDALLRATDGSDADAPDIARDVALLDACDAIVFVYPVWFGMPPAIIKGYVDRVFGARFEPEHVMEGALVASRLRGRHFLTFSTSAATLSWLDHGAQWEAMRRAFDRYLARIFGFSTADHVHFDTVVQDCTPHHVDDILTRTREAAAYTCEAVAEEAHGRAMRGRSGA